MSCIGGNTMKSIGNTISKGKKGVSSGGTWEKHLEQHSNNIW
jgi:hypothetical protein